MSRVTLVIVGDGRLDYLERCVESMHEHLKGQIDSAVMVCDEPQARSYLRDRYPDWKLIVHPVRVGMAAAVRAAWWSIGDGEYLFHLEEDFVFTEDVHLSDLEIPLRAEPRLAQVVLKRGPVNDEERAAGGIIEQHPDDYASRGGFVEHNRIFSLNPCLIPRDIVVGLDWEVRGVEGVEKAITRACLDAGRTFAFYGAKDDPPKVEHIGTERSSGWRL